MVDTYTSGKLGLIEPSRGAYVDTWDEPLYANWQTLEACISGTTTLTLTSSNVVLTVPTYPTYADPPTVATSAQNLRLLLQGTPSTNLTIYIPQTISGFWIVDDQTSGSTIITVKTTASGSTGIATSRGNTLFVFSDGTNVKLADSGNIIPANKLVIPGSMFFYAGTSAPSGYLLCNGDAVSRTTYSNLFSAIGTVWGTGDGATTFNVPNMVGMFARGIGGSGPASVGQYQSDGVGPLTINDPGHFHLYGLNFGASPGSALPGYQGTGSQTLYPQTDSAVTGIQITNTITETRPKNMGVLYIIKT